MFSQSNERKINFVTRNCRLGEGTRGKYLSRGTYFKGSGCYKRETSPRHRHSENCPDSEAMRDFAWGATRSFKPLHKICDFDLMFDAHIRDGHLHKAEPFLDTFHPFVLTQRSEPLRNGLEQ